MMFAGGAYLIVLAVIFFLPDTRGRDLRTVGQTWSETDVQGAEATTPMHANDTPGARW